jgi:sulfite exporter TauE/SafE
MQPTRRVSALVGVLLLHGFGALTWVTALGFGADIGTDRQFLQALTFGAVTWLIAAFVIVWLWRSGNSSVAIPFAWWLPSYLLMIALVYGW